MERDDFDLGSGSFNAGSSRTLEEARIDAQARATACQHPVTIYEHVGGRNTFGARVRPTGGFLWRDDLDADGERLPAPKRFYQVVETVQPA